MTATELVNGFFEAAVNTYCTSVHEFLDAGSDAGIKNVLGTGYIDVPEDLIRNIGLVLCRGKVIDNVNSRDTVSHNIVIRH